MGNSCTRVLTVSTQPVAKPEFADYKSAGCVFTNGKLVLGGFHPYKTAISGIGGKKNAASDRDYVDTAFRETLEELFGWKTVAPELVAHVRARMPTGKHDYYAKYKYVAITYSFEDLDAMLRALPTASSEFYEVMPRNTADLLLMRLKPTKQQEVMQLALLPVEDGLKIAEEFSEDIKHMVSEYYTATVAI